MSRHARATLALLLCLTLVACRSTAPTESAESARELAIGVGVPLTQGSVAFGQGMDRAVRVAAEEFNQSAEAKAAGITFEVVAGDDRGDPKSGVTVANEFASNPDIVGVVGHFNSGVSLPAGAVYNESRIVQITPSSTNTGLSQQGWDMFFRTCALDSDMARATAAALKTEVGSESVFVVDDGTVYGQGVADQFEAAAKELGLPIVGRDRVAEGEMDFSALITRIKVSGADSTFFGGTYQTAGPFARQLSEDGVDIPVASGGAMYNPDYIELAGAENAEGDIAGAFGSPIEGRAPAQAFLDGYAEMYPDDERQPYDGQAYDAAMVIMRAAAQVAGEQGADVLTTPEGREALRDAVAATDWEGATGTITFAENGDLIDGSVTVYRVQNGGWRPFVSAGEWPKAYE